MRTFRYLSGEEIRIGDRITYHNEPGEVDFVVSEKIGDAAMDWYIDQFPGGGVMIVARSFGSVFLSEDDIDENLVFVSRTG
jgi:hypothetical protein